MKATAYIFTTLMLFLMAQPVIINCQERMETCATVKPSCGGNSCSASQEKKETDKDSRERIPQDGCNPFAACSGCHFIAIMKSFQVSAPEVCSVQKIIPRNENRCSDFTGDAWNPPEFC